MRSQLAVICLCLTGCGVFDAPTITPDRETVTITMTVTEDMPENMNGRAWAYGDNCVVEVRRSIFPACVSHEVAHCFGWRHQEQYNSTYCKE